MSNKASTCYCSIGDETAAATYVALGNSQISSEQNEFNVNETITTYSGTTKAKTCGKICKACSTRVANKRAGGLFIHFVVYCIVASGLAWLFSLDHTGAILLGGFIGIVVLLMFSFDFVPNLNEPITDHEILACVVASSYPDVRSYQALEFADYQSDHSYLAPNKWRKIRYPLR